MGRLDSLRDGEGERERVAEHTPLIGVPSTLEPEASVTRPFDENGT
jgi:hypothetical protein